MALDELNIGKVRLFGGYWGVLNLQTTLPEHRSELRIFPLDGVTSDDPDAIGAEVVISNYDLSSLDSSGDNQVLAIEARKGEFIVQSEAGGNLEPAPIKFDSMGGYPNFTLNTDGTIGIARGISNSEGGGGFAHKRVPSCAGQTCETQVVWELDFSDTQYTATCTLVGAVGFVSINEKLASAMSLTVVHANGSDGGEVDCIAVHD